MSITRPHIRPIVRGKTGKPVEFGAKLSVSCFDFIELEKIELGAKREELELVDPR